MRNEPDVAMVLRNSDRVVVLDFGEYIAKGSPDVVSEGSAVRAAHLCEAHVRRLRLDRLRP